MSTISTISNERLEEMRDYDTCVRLDESAAMATELLALRKERERAEPVGYRKLFTCSSCGAEGLDEPLESRCHCNGDGARWIEGRLYAAPPAPSADDDSLPYDPQIAEYEQMMEAEPAQADTTSQQFESLAGKALVPAGWKLVPIELTKEMLKQIHPFAEATCLDCGNQVVADCVDNVTASWNDMLAVAPEPCK
ncbi:hypothetical protein ACTW2I_001610 [Cronobacter sakazakii]